jgi:1-acyl-sn-glycerol-3-phosphate acyltransferase
MRDVTYPPIIVALRTAFKVMNLTVDLAGADNVPRHGPALLAVNHISYVDFVLGGYAARPSKRLTRFMAKRELFDHRLVGPLMRSLHHIEVDRADGTASYRSALDFLRRGELVGIFPEATISRSFELKEFKSGVARLALEADVPIVPVVLWGTQRIMTKDHPRDFSRGHHVDITVGAPLTPAGRSPEVLLSELRARMSRLLDEAITRDPQTERGAWWVPKRFGGSAPTPAEAAALDAAERARRDASDDVPRRE